MDMHEWSQWERDAWALLKFLLVAVGTVVAAMVVAGGVGWAVPLL